MKKWHIGIMIVAAMALCMASPCIAQKEGDRNKGQRTTDRRRDGERVKKEPEARRRNEPRDQKRSPDADREERRNKDSRDAPDARRNEPRQRREPPQGRTPRREEPRAHDGRPNSHPPRMHRLPPRIYRPEPPTIIIHLPRTWPPLWPLPPRHPRPHARLQLSYEMRRALEMSEQIWAVIDCDIDIFGNTRDYDPDLRVTVRNEWGRVEYLRVSSYHYYYELFADLRPDDKVRFMFSRRGFDRYDDWWDDAAMHLRPLTLDRR